MWRPSSVGSEIFIANRYPKTPLVRRSSISIDTRTNHAEHRSVRFIIYRYTARSKYAAPTELVGFETPIAINISLLRSSILRTARPKPIHLPWMRRFLRNC
jgi:hypothetical protein